MTDEQRAREIDALVAEHVFGWKVAWGKTWTPHDWETSDYPTEDYGPGRVNWTPETRPLYTAWNPPVQAVPEFSTTWEGMGFVVERMEAEGWHWNIGGIHGTTGRYWYAELDGGGLVEEIVKERAGTIMLAVSFVALAAKGVDVAALVGGET